MDNKELVCGTSLFLPIFVEGANFSAGDGHGCQGDGEVCVTAIETALEGKFRLTIRDDLSLNLPQAETPSHFITMAFDEDLDDAAKEAEEDKDEKAKGEKQVKTRKKPGAESQAKDEGLAPDPPARPSRKSQRRNVTPPPAQAEATALTGGLLRTVG